MAEDGSVYTQLPGTEYLNQAGKLKLIKPNASDLIRADDGLFELANGVAAIDQKVRVVQGAFESSNVSSAASMVQMIAEQRAFDLNMRSLTTADQNAKSLTGLLSLSRA